MRWWIRIQTPTKVDFAIPSNDDASKSIKYITDYLVDAIKEGLEERRTAREEKAAEKVDA